MCQALLEIMEPEINEITEKAVKKAVMPDTSSHLLSILLQSPDSPECLPPEPHPQAFCQNQKLIYQFVPAGFLTPAFSTCLTRISATEYNLNTKPLEIDLLVIKKESHVQIENEIGCLFRGHNIMEYTWMPLYFYLMFTHVLSILP